MLGLQFDLFEITNSYFVVDSVISEDLRVAVRAVANSDIVGWESLEIGHFVKLVGNCGMDDVVVNGCAEDENANVDRLPIVEG